MRFEPGSIFFSLILLSLLLLESEIMALECRGLPDRNSVASLMGSGRDIGLFLHYDGIAKVDTGSEIDSLHVLHDSCGRQIYLMPDGRIKNILTSTGRSYKLRVRLVNFTPDGLPLARISDIFFTTVQNPDRFTGDIRQSDMRIRELKTEIATGNAPPDLMRLRYGGVRHWIYLIFYDIEGRMALYRFRDTRWDDREAKLLERLVEGRAYSVSGEFTGLLYLDRFLSRDDSEFDRIVTENDSVPVFRFKNANPLPLERILF